MTEYMLEGVEGRPKWCPHADCETIRRVDILCGGKLSKPQEHNRGRGVKGYNTHRLCMNAMPYPFRLFVLTQLLVNNNDLNILRWIFEAMEEQKTGE